MLVHGLIELLFIEKLKNLENHISISVVHPDMLENGWIFDAKLEGN